jgi:hypothetical protein
MRKDRLFRYVMYSLLAVGMVLLLLQWLTGLTGWADQPLRVRQG